MLTFFAATASSGNSSSGSSALVVVFLAVFAVVVGLIFYINARQNKKMSQYAQKQGWQVMSTDDATLGNCVPTYLRNKRNSQGHTYHMAYQVPDNGQNIVFFRYEDIDAGNNFRLDDMANRQQKDVRRVPYSIAAFSVPQTFGYMLLFHHSRVDNYGLHSGLQKFTLEGDFGKYFDVYAPQGSSIETLSVLTPDVMAYLIDLGQAYHWNVEVNGNLVIIEGDGNLITPAKVSSLLDYAKALRQKLETKPVVPAEPAGVPIAPIQPQVPISTPLVPATPPSSTPTSSTPTSPSGPVPPSAPLPPMPPV